MPYDKKRHPVLGNLRRASAGRDAAVDASASRTRPTQYLYTSDAEPGRIYKMTLDGKILGMFGESGHDVEAVQLGRTALACPSENAMLVADMNNWRVQKLTLRKSVVGSR